MKHLFLSTLVALFALNLSGCASTPKTDLSKDDQSKMYVEMATANLNEGDAKSSLAFLKQAKALTPERPETHYLLALTYHRLNEIDLAIASARDSLRYAPGFTPAKNTLGKLLLDQGKLNEAEALLKDAANDLTYREAFIAKTNLGTLYRKKLNDSQAEFWLNKAIFEAGDYACMAYYFRGQIYFEQNKIEKAASDFQKASKNSCAQFSDAYLAQGKALMRLKKNDQARAKFLEVQQLFPSSEAAGLANEYLRDLP